MDANEAVRHMTSSVPLAPSWNEILAAQERLRSVAIQTPLLESGELNARIGGRLLIKAETFQLSGSFKFRGAYNRLVQLSSSERRRGVVAYSSGNHALAVATAATMIGANATVIMPHDAPKIKAEKIRCLGARIVFYDRVSDHREDIAHEIARQTDAILVPPFDDPHIIAGQATAAVEALAQLARLNLSADALLASCGGGGLTSGCALAASHSSARTNVYAVEPVDFDRVRRSLMAGTPVSIDSDDRTICDSLMARTPGRLTFVILRAFLAGSITVSDADVATAVLVAFRDLKLVVEPGGAAALAAVLSGRFDGRDKITLVICSGGNVDPDAFASLIDMPRREVNGQSPPPE
jgi:threonine dehydratase